MRAFIVGLALLLISLLPADAPAGELQADIASGMVHQDVFPQTRVRFAGGVVAVPNIEYANLAGYRPLLLDLYSQEKPQDHSPKPLVIYIHGGNWDRGDSRTSGAFADFPAVLASLAARGYVVASINYRLMGEARFPAQIQDVNAAIGFLRAHAAQYGIDASRVVLWGGSSGGHLAALAATSCGEAAFQPLPSTGRQPKFPAVPAGRAAAPGCVQGAVIWYGIFDFRPLLSSNPAYADTRAAISKFLGCRVEDCPSTVAQLSPVTHVCASTPPMLLVHGTDDAMVPAEQSRSMAEHLRRAGVAVETLFIPQVGHALIGKTPAATRRASLLALRRSFDFIDRITRPAAATRSGQPANIRAPVLAAD